MRIKMSTEKKAHYEQLQIVESIQYCLLNCCGGNIGGAAVQFTR